MIFDFEECRKVFMNVVKRMIKEEVFYYLEGRIEVFVDMIV